MQDKKRLSINIIAQLVSFAVQFGINFFLTPFVVKQLGTDAYGFIGLSNTFVSYAQVLTVALNSMAGRFIAIEYHKGNIEGASKYFTSVFYANLIIAIILGIIAVGCTCYLEMIINIPAHLVFDVKLLFSLLICNFLVSIVFSVYNVATFIKNRLDYVAERSIVGNIIRACIIVLAFALFVPMLWYFGLASIICTLYISFVNLQYKRRLTPDLSINPTLFNSESVKTVVKSGVWNSVSRLSNILEQGFDLLLANWFIGTYFMGQLSITKQIPIIVLALMGAIGSAFAPSLTKSFAMGSYDDINKEIILSVKLMGFFASIPLCFIFSCSDVFYELWLPGEDYKLLYYLTIISTSFFPILLSLEGTQNLWPVLNKVKVYSLASLIMSCCIFITLFIGLRFIPENYRFFYLVGVSAFYNMLFTLVFIPIFASKCLHVKPTFFYPSIIKVLATIFIVSFLLLGVKVLVCVNSWGILLLCCFIDCVLCILFGAFIIWSKNDRLLIISRIRNRLVTPKNMG